MMPSLQSGSRYRETLDQGQTQGLKACSRDILLQSMLKILKSSNSTNSGDRVFKHTIQQGEISHSNLSVCVLNLLNKYIQHSFLSGSQIQASFNVMFLCINSPTTNISNKDEDASLSHSDPGIIWTETEQQQSSTVGALNSCFKFTLRYLNEESVDSGKQLSKQC